MARLTRVQSTTSYRSLQTARILVIVFTTLFLLTGLLFLVSGSYTQVKLTYLVELLKSTTLATTHLTPLLLIFVGLFIILSSLLGFFSAVKDNLCVINCFCLLLGIVCIIEVVGAILAAAFLGKFKAAVRVGMEAQLQNFTTNSTLNVMHADLECCGVESFLDFNKTVNWAAFESESCEDLTAIGGGFVIPSSCCPGCFNSCPRNSSETAEAAVVNDVGCYEKLFGRDDDVNFLLHYIIITMFALLVFQIIGVLFVTCLNRRLNATLRGY